jgi:hypothetical protein
VRKGRSILLAEVEVRFGDGPRVELYETSIGSLTKRIREGVR